MKTILARTLLLAGVGVLPVLAGNQILLRNLNSADGSPKLLAAGTSEQLYVVSDLLTSPTQPITRVVELDMNGVRLASIDLSQMASPSAAMTDPKGDLLVAGTDQSYQGVVVKVDPALSTSTILVSLPGTISAVAVDKSGNVYVTGSTSSASFPVTAGAYQTTPPYNGDPRLPTYGYATDTFLTEISSAGKIVYSTYFGSDTTSCVGGSFCIGKYGTTNGTAIAVDASGGVVIAGTTTATGLPTTAGAIAPACVCGYNLGLGAITAGFIARFQPGGTQQLQWSTYLNATYSPRPLTLNGIALDSSGNVLVGGGADSGLPSTAGAFQVTPGSSPTSGAYLLKVSNTGTAVLWGSYYDNQARATQTVLLDAQGRVVFSGYAGSAFVARVTSDGATLSDFYQGPPVYDLAGPALTLTPTGGFAAMFPGGALWIETTSPGPSLLDITNSASGEYANSIAPLELITLYGVGIGPQTPLNGQLQNRAYTSSLGGYQVLFNSVALPLLYADSNQINTVLPSGAGGTPHIQVVTPTGTIDGPTVPTTYTPAPGVFQNWQTGLAAALNQDGSVNSTSRPAAAGSIVTVFADANSGQFFPDGSLVPLAIYDATASVWVVDGNLSLEVVWAGAAPGIVNGVMQINFRLPQTLPATQDTFAFSVIVGGVAGTQNVIAVAP